MTMEVVAAALSCQLILIMLMAAMLLLRMKSSPLPGPRTIELQEIIGKETGTPALLEILSDFESDFHLK
ncbi:hypothetical protein STEG23_017345, partial [Scotinomys teguina]